VEGLAVRMQAFGRGSFHLNPTDRV